MRRFRVSLWVCLACLGLAGAIAANPAEAQQMAPGVQAGVSLDPDQFYFGGHIETSPLIERLRFRPSVDVGIGDVTTVSGNFEFTYTFPGGRPWNLYVGGGPTINWYDFDNGGSDTEAGFNCLGGVIYRAGLFFEVKVGVEGSPNMKFGVGYTFR
jgi:hypothetical protein